MDPPNDVQVLPKEDTAIVCLYREGVCTKDLETLWELIASSETAFSHTPDLLDE